MPLLHNCAYKVLQQIIEIENELKDLHRTMEESIRRSDRRAVFCAHVFVEFDLDCVRDQIPKKFKNFAEKVTVDCGNTTYCGTGEVIHHIFELDIKDVHVPKDYDSEGEFPDNEFACNSDD